MTVAVESVVVTEERGTGGEIFTSYSNKSGSQHSARNIMDDKQISLEWINGV